MTQRIGHKLRACLLVFALLGTGSVRVFAASVTYNFNNEFSSGTPPASATTPWLTAVFTDGATPGTVTLTLTAPHLSGTEFVSGWYFNLGPNSGPGMLDPTKLHFSSGTVGSGALTLPTITEALNAYKADGDGKYDILLSFSVSGGA